MIEPALLDDFSAGEPDFLRRFGKRCGSLLGTYEQNRAKLHKVFWDSFREQLTGVNSTYLKGIPERRLQDACDEVGIPGKATLADARQSGHMDLLRFQSFTVRYQHEHPYSIPKETVLAPTMRVIKCLREHAGETTEMLGVATFKLLRMALCDSHELFEAYRGSHPTAHRYYLGLAKEAHLCIPRDTDCDKAMMDWGPAFVVIHAEMLQDWERTSV